TGSPAPAFSIGDGSTLPAWLTLATTCGDKTAPAGQVYLCGTPPPGTANAEYTFDVVATNNFDGSDHTATETITVEVFPGEVAVTLSGPDGDPYSYYPVYSEQVVLTATLTVSTGANPAPSMSKDEGAVQFFFYNWNTDQSTSIDATCDAVTVVNSQAQCTIPVSALPWGGGPDADGTFEVWASYSGGDDYYSNDSNTLELYEYPAATTTSVTSSLNPSTFGQSTTFTATVTADQPATIGPTTQGTVTFENGGAVITGCGAVALVAGQATCTTSALAGGNHNITATFSSTADYYSDSGPSVVLVQGVQPAATSTTLTAAPSSPIDVSDGTSHSVTYTATVTAGGSPVTAGSVTFADNLGAPPPVYSCTVTVATDGTAQCSISYSNTGAADAGVGEHSVTATYSDSAGNYATSSDSYTMDIDVAPQYTSADSGNATIGVPFSFLVGASGFPAPTFSLAQGFSLPDGLSLAAT
ncbi:MAG TPA: Ig-like domain repeat protein, partial [Tepidiformaceae bacterium]|nr:Ig-like domain repeat protein [Tepidiformaceae bacterium]